MSATKPEQDAPRPIQINVHGNMNIAQHDVTNILSSVEIHFPQDGGMPIANISRATEQALSNPLLQQQSIVPDMAEVQELFTAAGMILWGKLQAAGIIDLAYQPKTGWAKAAIIANVMSQQLYHKTNWKPFEALWNHKNLRNNFSTAWSSDAGSADYAAEIRALLE